MGRRVKNPPYVQEFLDRTGRPRWYFRRSGRPRVPLPGLPWSPEFMAAHEAAMSAEAAPVAADRTIEGTVNAALIAYRANPAWREGLSAGTRAARNPILERFREEHGDKRMRLLEERHILKILDSRPTHHARRNLLKALRGFMAFSADQRIITTDPTRAIKLRRPRVKSSGFMVWGMEQVAQYRAHHPLGTMPRLAIELLLNIAARRQDVYRLGRPHERGGKLTWRPAKTLDSTGKTLTIRIMPPLRAALDAMPPSTALTYISTEYGRPFASAAAFGNRFADWCDAAQLAPVVCDDGRTRNFRAHGLRKAALRHLAHSGCTAVELQAVGGHATLSQLQVYIAEVEQELMAEAAMKKMAAYGGP